MTELYFDIEDSFDSSSLSKPSEGKSLNRIFDVRPRMKSGKSLRYPKSKELSERPNNELPWTTRFAKIVIGFKNGENIGRVGVGIIQNYKDKYRLIVYKTKSNVIATFTIQESVDVPQIHRQNCYWQFYDDIGVYWSLLFERSSEEVDFINKLRECEINIKLENGTNPNGVPKINKLDRLEASNEKNEKFENFNSDASKDLGTLTVTNERYNKERSNTNVSQTNNRRMRTNKIQWKESDSKNQNYNNNDDDADVNVDDEKRISELRSSLTLIDQNTYPTISELHKQYLLPITHLSTIDTPTSSQVLNSVDGQVVQLMLAENRTQNTELRMNMDKIDSKIEKVLDKLSTLNNNGGQQDDEFLKLEEQILSLKKENRRLKQDLKNITSKSEIRQYGNIGCLYGIDLANLGIDVPTHGKPDEVEAIIGNLIDKIQKLKTQLDDNKTQLHFENLQNQEEKQQNVMLTNELNQVKRKIELLEMEVDKGKQSESQFVLRLNEFKSQHVTLLDDIKLGMISTLKDIMNTLYHNLAHNIVNMENLDPDKLLALIGKTIRQDTLCAVAKITNK